MARPVADPDKGSIVATDVFPLLQVPPPDTSLNVVVAPRHSPVVPEMNAGRGSTVTLMVFVQPVVFNV